MRSVNITLAVVFLALFAISCEKGGEGVQSTNSGTAPAAKATATPDEFAAVRPIYKENCARCHGENGDGGQVTEQGKKLRVPNLKAEHAMKHSDQDYVEQIMNGGDGMPTFKGKLQPDQVDGLVKFVRKEFQKK
jgi:mono/diheme cytochrome c family protein